MAEGLATAGGERIDLSDPDRAFGAAMAAPRADDPQHPAPPPIDPDAPFGRKVDGTPKKRPGGRPPKTPAARTTTAVPPPGDGKGPAGPADYQEGLTEFFDGVWLALAATPVPAEALRIRVRAQAAVLKANQEGLARGVNVAAQHNGQIRWAVEKVTTGNGAWLLPAMFAVAPFAVQTAQVWRVPVEGDLRNLAEATEAEWDKMFAGLKDQLAELAGEAAAAAAGPGDGLRETPAA
jgi:hypothetical protein